MVDSDFRFGYEFVHGVPPSLNSTLRAQMQAACGAALVPAQALLPKHAREPRLHVEECALSDQLPRPRLAKSLRQLYGNSADAETRIRTFFHRVHDVDAFMLEHEFTSCEYCKEGWFGTKRTREELPGQFESVAFRKNNFLLAPAKAAMPLCRNCLSEAKARLPRPPFRFATENHVDPGRSLPETDALTFFEEAAVAYTAHSAHLHAARYWPV